MKDEQDGMRIPLQVGDTLRRSWGVLNQNGRLVTIAAGSETTSDERIKEAFFVVEPNRQQLVEIGRLLDAGELRLVVDNVLPFSRPSEAFAGTIERKGRGKLVVALVEPKSVHTGGSGPDAPV